MSDRVWTDADYDSMDWHDVAVHGLRFVEGDHGRGLLELDIDYILEWIQDGDHFNVRREPATLTFHGVCRLRMSIEYASVAFSPFSIDRIERHMEQRNGYAAHLWKIPINAPSGEITFEAEGFEQRGRGRPCVTSAGALRPEERGENSPSKPVD